MYWNSQATTKLFSMLFLAPNFSIFDELRHSHPIKLPIYGVIVDPRVFLVKSYFCVDWFYLFETVFNRLNTVAFVLK